MNQIIDELWSLGHALFPINRSITGPGFRQSLNLIEEFAGPLDRLKFESGAQVLDWVIPLEWEVTEAWIKAPDGKIFCDVSENSLHLVGYSEAFEGELTLDQLLPHLYSLPEQPDAIPYVTSYYNDRWGFCITQAEKDTLTDGVYQVRIKSKKTQGNLEIGEVFLPGKNPGEILFSTYLCHPAMANNELSGPLVMAGLIKELMAKKLTHSYRFLFLPETIGSISYLSRNLEAMRLNLRAGWVLTTIGDDRNFSFLPSRSGNRFVDRFSRSTLAGQGITFKEYSWQERGSDERQFCAPGIDLPVASLMRTKYAEYPEYHTSLDQFDTVVTKKGLSGSLKMLSTLVQDLERQSLPRATQLGEPQLSRRNLLGGISMAGSYPNEILDLMNILSMADGDHSVSELADYFGLDEDRAEALVEKLSSLGLVTL